MPPRLDAPPAAARGLLVCSPWFWRIRVGWGLPMCLMPDGSQVYPSRRRSLDALEPVAQLIALLLLRWPRRRCRREAKALSSLLDSAMCAGGALRSLSRRSGRVKCQVSSVNRGCGRGRGRGQEGMGRRRCCQAQIGPQDCRGRATQSRANVVYGLDWKQLQEQRQTSDFSLHLRSICRVVYDSSQQYERRRLEPSNAGTSLSPACSALMMPCRLAVPPSRAVT